MSDLIERIRRRAYEIWEGNSDGSAEDHWLQAEREILGSAAAPPEAFHGDGAGLEGTRAYDDHATKFGANGRVEEKMREAEAALDGPERDELARAEQAGKNRAKSA
jgi:Protein of unknown function (DUF2934)